MKLSPPSITFTAALGCWTLYSPILDKCDAMNLRRDLKPKKPHPKTSDSPTESPTTTIPPTDPPANDLPYPTCTKTDGSILRLWTMDAVQSNTTFCNIVFYDRVYVMDEFIPIHKGGAEAIERNCQKDGTWLFENLQCISMVPDHFEGMLNMCTGYEEGVIAGSAEDPCANTNDGTADPNWVKPIHLDPDFTDCDAYYNITCDALQDLDNPPLLPLPLETQSVISDFALNKRRWTLGDVESAQAKWTTPSIGGNYTEHCYVLLHGWIYDLAISPLDGSDPFYLKHGNGMFPWEILKHCGADMNANDAFDAIDDMGKVCAPDHTLGALNVLTGYLVGVELGGPNDACSDENVALSYPPDACQTHVDSGLVNYTLETFESLPESDFECYMILQGGVYNLAEFALYHAGGSSKITTQCGKDGTRTFLSKSFHKHRIFLESLQDFKTGVIVGSEGDPCDPGYDEAIWYW